MPRGRSESAHRKVLDSTVELVAERGVDATSMDAIAEASGVSKATIYKHWADKDALLLDMLAEINGLHLRPKFESGNTQSDMTDVLAYRPEEGVEVRERIMPHFMSYSARNPKFGQAWRNLVMEPPRRELRILMRRGVEKGELSPALDLETSLATLIGPILYWHVFLREVVADPRPIAEYTVTLFWRAFSVDGRVEKAGAEKNVNGAGKGRRG